MKINIKKVLKEAAEKKLKPKPVPRIRVKSAPKEKATVAKASEVKIEIPVQQTTPILTDASNDLIAKLELELAGIKKERAKLSTRIGQRIDQGATDTDLANLYNEIESFRPRLTQLYKNIEHVRMHGSLPEEPADRTTKATSLLELKDRKRKLSDKRCKLKRKLTPSGKPPKAEFVTEWQLELAQANAEYEDVEMQIKTIEGNA